MDDDELFDLLTSIEEQVPIQEKAGRFEREASELDPGVFGRASLLVTAGEHWQMRGEYDEARRCFQQAREDGGESRSDPVANLGASAARPARRRQLLDLPPGRRSL